MTKPKFVLMRPALGSTGTLIEIGTAVRLEANGLPGKVQGVWQHVGTATRYSAEYVTPDKTIHAEWFRAEEFTLAPPPKPARKL